MLKKLGFKNKAWALGGATVLPAAVYGYQKLLGTKGIAEVDKHLKRDKSIGGEVYGYTPAHIASRAYALNPKAALVASAGVGATMAKKMGDTLDTVAHGEPRARGVSKAAIQKLTLSYKAPALALAAAGAMAGLGLGLTKKENPKHKEVAMLSAATGLGSAGITAAGFSKSKLYAKHPKLRANHIIATGAIGAALPAMGYGWNKLEKWLAPNEKKTINTT